jgi:cyclophilin family peptidyl-prolyl cis-trans isomerase
MKRLILLTVSLSLIGALSPVQAAPQTKGQEVKRVASDPVVLIETTKGPIKLEIFKKEAPRTAENFLDLVKRGFYNGLSFHRYEPGFVIQGGDPNGNGSGDFVDPSTKRTRNIALEKNPDLRHNAAGILAMARSSDPNSASCQFYITLDRAEFLDNPPGYAVFGKVLEGLNSVKALRAGDKMLKVSLLETTK